MREQMELQIQGNGRCEDSDMLLRDGGALAKYTGLTSVFTVARI